LANNIWKCCNYGAGLVKSNGVVYFCLSRPK
jgi:hypothetical protein